MTNDDRDEPAAERGYFSMVTRDDGAGSDRGVPFRWRAKRGGEVVVPRGQDLHVLLCRPGSSEAIMRWPLEIDARGGPRRVRSLEVRVGLVPVDGDVTAPREPRIACRGVDVTDHVAAMFDAIVDALDWGSDFLSTETVESVLTVAALAGFDVREARAFDVTPPGFAENPEAIEFPAEAEMPEGGWPSDRPEVWERAQRAREDWNRRVGEAQDAHERGRREALERWRAQVAAKARALVGDADD